MSKLEDELKQLIVSTLNLEDLTPAEIAAEEPLFGDGLGLDSIDALEIGMAIARTYGIKIKDSDKNLKPHFRSVRTLAAFVAAQREAVGGAA
jgi:acyl carrier protein